MGLLAQALNPRPRAQSGQSPSALDSFWYTADPSGYVLESSPSGLTLGPETILRCWTVYAAVKFRGASWAMCPPSTYRKTSKGRQEMPDHYSQRVLRNPNRWQTGFEWRYLHGVWMALWGNAYSEMIGGARSFVEELRPLHPSICKPVDQRADGSLLYEVTKPGEPKRTIGQEQMLHFRDLSTDGIQGVPMYRLIRTVVGIALLAERHAATFLAKGARISGLIVPDRPLTDEQRKELRESVNKETGGSSNAGTFGLMPAGVDLKPISVNNKDAQSAELSAQTVTAILGFLGVPGVIVGHADKTATYASAEAFFEKGGIKHCVLPILINVEAREEKALLLPDSGLQIKHNLDVLERANARDRTESLVRSVGGPFRSVNEARTIEDMDRLPDPRYDEVLTPGNMSPEPEPEPEPDPPPPPFAAGNPDEEDDDDESDDGPSESALRARARWLAQSAAAQVVRREIAAITDKAPKLARNQAAWRQWVESWYESRHVPHLVKALGIPEDKARDYCRRQASELLAPGGGVQIMGAWLHDNVPRLVALALGEE